MARGFVNDKNKAFLWLLKQGFINLPKRREFGSITNMRTCHRNDCPYNCIFIEENG